MQKHQLQLKWFTLTMLSFVMAVTSLRAQCPDPAIVFAPNPPCGFPVDLEVTPAGGFAAYKWNTTQTTGKITITAPGTYAVTVTCNDGSTKTASRLIKVYNVVNTAKMTSNVLRPCLLGQEVNLSIQLLGPMTGVNVITIASSTGDTIVFEQTVTGGLTTITYPVNPTVVTTYTLLSVKNITNNCNYTIIGPKTTTVTPLFNSQSEFPVMGGNPFFCLGGNTWLSVISADNPAPLSYSWSGLSPFPTTSLPVYNATVEGNYYVNINYSPECWILLDTFVEEDIPLPDITGGPVCNGNSATLSTAENYVTYQWSTGSSDPQITIEEPGQYRVTITNDHGCTGVGFQTVPSYPSPVPSINGPISLCTGQTTANLSVTGANIATYAWSTGESSDHIIANGPGEYTVTVTSNFGCTETSSQVIEQVTTPTVSLPSPFLFCEGTTNPLVPVTSTPDVIYQWSNGATTATIPVTQGGVYRVTVYDFSGECKSSAFTLATALPAPHPDIAASASTICDGASATLDAGGSTGNYLWSNGSTGTSINVNTGGNYTVTVTAANGCTGSDTQSISLLPASPATNIAFKPLCNRTVELTADPGFNTYQWSNGITAQSIQTGNAGVYTVTVSNAAGCTRSSSYNVTILPSAPAPSLAPVSNLCPQAVINIQPSGTYVAYQWSNGSTTAAISTNLEGTYTVTVTDGNGCTGTASQLVNAAAPPVPDIAGSLSICNGGATTLSVSGSYNAFNWSTGATTASISAGASGDYTVTVTSQQGCTGTASAQVSVSTFLTPNIAAEPYNCDNQVVLFAGAGYNSYQWSNGASTSSIAVSNPGDYTLTVTNNAGCIGTAVQNLSAIPSTPQLAIQGVSTFCENASATLTASPGFDVYTWSSGDFTNAIAVTTGGMYTVTATDVFGCSKVATQSVIVNPAPSPAITAAPFNCNGFITLDAGGPYTAYNWQGGNNSATLDVFVAGNYLITITNQEGCTGTASYTVSEVPSRPQVDIEGPNRICTGSIGILAATVGFQSYVWSDGTFNTVTTTQAAGTFTVTVTDNNNCTATAEFHVDLLDAPVPVIVQAPYECHGAITLSAGAFETYAWSNGEQSATTSVTTSGAYTVTVIDADGCIGTSTAQVDVPVAPDPQIAVSAQPNYSVLLEATPGFASYAWSNGAQTASFVTHENGTYTVTITDAQGCTGTAEVVVQLEAPPLVVTSTFEDLTCANGNDGFLGICVTGGVAPYVLNISPAAQLQQSSTPDCPNFYSANSLSAGTYNWEVVDVNGVVLSGSSTYTNPAPLVVGISANGMTITATASGGEGPYQYSIDGVNFQSSPVFPNLPNGSYQVSVLDERGCTALTPSVTVFTSGTNDIADNWDLSITPNPGDGNFQLHMNNCQTEEIRLSIRDVAGRLLHQTTLATGGCHDFMHAINLTSAPSGTYWVEVRAVEAVKVVKLVVVR